MKRPHAIPTALTSLFRTPETLREGDGVVLVFPDGSQRHGTVATAEGATAIVSFPDGTIRAEIEWEAAE
ncbi:hypothetical protein SPF06_00865 [Sinomonas sp. JGH33]|uniref:Uncharacterized protein n=1 Tax=Sinomonas terricola TaxID=3110330 RepID=A0ABU5T254_9MICC|nr:hypothetical protein [Sinomonas sp. JGH33]MEA5453261.1 hypothetical protein [Sinomonas sp. JGH33]